MNRFALFVAAIVAVILFTPTAEAYTVDVAIVADHACGDIMPQALGDRDYLLESYRNADGSWADDLNILEAIYMDLPDEEAESMSHLFSLVSPMADEVLASMEDGFVRFYTPPLDGEGFNGRAGYRRSLTACGPTKVGAHEDLHVLDMSPRGPDGLHKRAYYNPETNEMGLDGAPQVYPGAKMIPLISEANKMWVSKGFVQFSGETAPGWLATPELPGFEFRVYITPVGGQTIDDTKAEPCIPETLCVSGALEGRPEVFIKIIGPRPNGYLWVQISRFTPSTVEIWVRQLSTGQVNEYFLRHVPSGFGHLDVSGLQDREAFLP